ncbi:MAG: M28 family peptidase [Candidatus Marinimicrobia bacterium]|nr:M28 family peptidase [Candidatus Neomarinimicrobiota bacterium]
MRIHIKIILIIFTMNVLSSCNNAVPKFDKGNAFRYLVEQCEFGPRNPNSNGYKQCLDYLQKTLAGFADTIFLQPFVLDDLVNEESYDLTNIIARFKVDEPEQILIGAHWDTRPWADEDPEPEKRNDPIVGANDGASGVAVVLELARILNVSPPPIGVTLVLFDGEDMGRPGIPKSYAQGSLAFAKDLPIEKPDEAIILDMIGDAELHIPIERFSYQQNRQLVKKLWGLAKVLNLGAFESRIIHTIYDDHVPLWAEAKIPAVDIIDFNYPNSNKNYWHTTQDLPENCSAESLGQVGTLLVHYIYGRQK